MPPNNESSTHVMNPLMGSSLTSRTSMHCLSSSAEPSMKKIRLAGSFHGKGLVKTKSNTSLLMAACEGGGGMAKSSSIAAIGKDVTLPSEAAAAAAASNATSADHGSQAARASQVTPSRLPTCDPPRDGSREQFAADSELPDKMTKYSHLKTKYHTELSYMLREFEKLERQLLGARKTEENAGSKERREKLHSFILHLQDTIHQIEAGVRDEIPAAEAGGAEAQPEKLDDTVQKLEEHILANLLPVKVRLKKQLAAQQGAKHNPVGMPHNSGWSQPLEAGTKGTFAAAAEKKRREAEQAIIGPREPAQPVEPHKTQYGKPIEHGGSSLTKKLHGQTLGKSADPSSAVGEAGRETKRYYAGMALGSCQIESSVTAASSVHKLMVRDTEKLLQVNRALIPEQKEPPTAPPPPKDIPTVSSDSTQATPNVPAVSVETVKPIFAEPRLDLEEMERRRRRRRRRRKRIQREKDLKGSQPVELEVPKAKKARTVKKIRGPRQVEYMCALCNEVYNSTCEYNPWWALAQHECPKCHKTQVPKVDISAPANAIEYHPALLAHADDNAAAAAQPPPPPEVEPVAVAPSEDKGFEDTISLGSDVSSGLDDVSSDDDDSLDLDSDMEDLALTPADRAENESFGAHYEGPKLEDKDASRLLVLMAHASSCSGQHRSQQQRDVCRSTRWMMLHVRDCPGTTATFDICPFPWCRKVKHLLYHLVSCTEGNNCNLCNDVSVSEKIQQLRGLNGHRMREHREELCKRAPVPQCCIAVNSTAETSTGNASTLEDLAEMAKHASVSIPQGTVESKPISSPGATADPAEKAPAVSIPAPVPTQGVPIATTQAVSNPMAQSQATSQTSQSPKAPPVETANVSVVVVKEENRSPAPAAPETVASPQTAPVELKIEQVPKAVDKEGNTTSIPSQAATVEVKTVELSTEAVAPQQETVTLNISETANKPDTPMVVAKSTIIAQPEPASANNTVGAAEQQQAESQPTVKVEQTTSPPVLTSVKEATPASTSETARVTETKEDSATPSIEEPAAPPATNGASEEPKPSAVKAEPKTIQDQSASANNIDLQKVTQPTASVVTASTEA